MQDQTGGHAGGGIQGWGFGLQDHKDYFFLFSFHLRSKYLESNLFQSGVCLTSMSSRHCMIIINLYKYVCTSDDFCPPPPPPPHGSTLVRAITSCRKIVFPAVPRSIWALGWQKLQDTKQCAWITQRTKYIAKHRNTLWSVCRDWAQLPSFNLKWKVTSKTNNKMTWLS